MTDTNKFKGKNIAFIDPYSDFATNPTLIALSEKFLAIGANVHVFCPAVKDFPQLSKDITQHAFPYRFRIWHYGKKRTLIDLKNYFFSSAWQAHSAFKNNSYDLLLGINCEGVIASWQLSKKYNIPYIYLSFEMFFHDELTKLSEHQEKQHEIIASQQAAMIIIQDKWRAKLLASENDIPESKFFYMPVSPADSERIKSNYLRKKYNISDEKLIILHSGSFENWTYAEELITSLQHWPANAILIVHTRKNFKHKNKYIDKIKNGHFKNVVLSLYPLQSREYEKMVASSDMGICLYKQVNTKYLQKNIQTIGLASGKFSYYMKYGLPVISVRQENYAELLEKYSFGKNINDFSEIDNAINQISQNYNSYSCEARRLFSEQLDFNIFWPDFIDQLSNIIT